MAALSLATLVVASVTTEAAAPLLFPQSDTAVVYLAAGNVRQTLRFSAALGRQRVDAPGGGLSIITDNVGRTTAILDNRAHTVTVEPAPPGTADMRGRRAPADYVRSGAAVIAGLPCTEWATHDPSGHPVTVCITADGVLTRVRAANDVLVEAVAVDHAAQDPALFTPPPAWRRVGR